jgi:hypothetical protein
MTAVACESIDPTEQFLAISFRNDLARTPTLRACGDDASRHFIDDWTLAPGDSASDNISDRSVRSSWLVEVDGGRRCLPLEFDAKYGDVVVRLSQARPCPGRTLLPADVHHGAKQHGET